MLLKNNKNNKGFTLIELLVAMCIISIVIFSFFTIVNFSIKQSSKNEKDIKALNIAQSEIESLRKEIKASTNKIILYKQDGTELIKISDEKNEGKDKIDIDWEPNGTTENIKIYPGPGNYEKYIGIGDNGKQIIQYNRNVEDDSTNYIVKLDLSRQEKASRYLYTVKVKVIPEGSLSKKEVTLSTSVLSK